MDNTANNIDMDDLRETYDNIDSASGELWSQLRSIQYELQNRFCDDDAQALVEEFESDVDSMTEHANTLVNAVDDFRRMLDGHGEPPCSSVRSHGSGSDSG